MKIILVIGLIGCGKSSFCQLFKEKGAAYINLDKVVDTLYTTKKELEKKLLKTFGQEILNHGKICKNKIANLVFKDFRQLKILESILHPLVKENIQKTIQTLKKSNNPLIVIEMPAIKTTLLDFIKPDHIIIIDADKQLRQERLVSKGLTSYDFNLRQEHQKVPFFPKKNNFFVSNNRSMSALKEEVEQIYNLIKTN